MIDGRVRTIQSDLGLTIQAIAAEQTSHVQWQRRSLSLYPIAKRLFDLVFALIMLIVSAPVMAIVALAIELNSMGGSWCGPGQNPLVSSMARSPARWTCGQRCTCP